MDIGGIKYVVEPYGVLIDLPKSVWKRESNTITHRQDRSLSFRKFATLPCIQENFPFVSAYRQDYFVVEGSDNKYNMHKTSQKVKELFLK